MASWTTNNKQICLCTYMHPYVNFMHMYVCWCMCIQSVTYNMFYTPTVGKPSGSRTPGTEVHCQNMNNDGDKWDFSSIVNSLRQDDLSLIRAPSETGKEITTSGIFFSFFLLPLSFCRLLANVVKHIMSSWIISGQREEIFRQVGAFCIKTVFFLTSTRESTEAEGGRGAGQEQTPCLQRA